MLYAPSDFSSVTVPEDARGCGTAHHRPAGPDGRPAEQWRLDCEMCCAVLPGIDDRWSKTAEDVKPTFDEARARERFLERGKSDHEAITALAMARMAGLAPAEIPDTIQKMIAGVRTRVAGETLCPQGGHPNSPGSRFCRGCGAAMTVPAPAPELPAGTPQ